MNLLHLHFFFTECLVEKCNMPVHIKREKNNPKVKKTCFSLQNIWELCLTLVPSNINRVSDGKEIGKLMHSLQLIWDRILTFINDNFIVWHHYWALLRFMIHTMMNLQTILFLFRFNFCNSAFEVSGHISLYLRDIFNLSFVLVHYSMQRIKKSCYIDIT